VAHPSLDGCWVQQAGRQAGRQNAACSSAGFSMHLCWMLAVIELDVLFCEFAPTWLSDCAAYMLSFSYAHQ